MTKTLKEMYEAQFELPGGWVCVGAYVCVCVCVMVGRTVKNSQSLYLFTFNTLIIIHVYSIYLFVFSDYIYIQ